MPACSRFSLTRAQAATWGGNSIVVASKESVLTGFPNRMLKGVLFLLLTMGQDLVYSGQQPGQ